MVFLKKTCSKSFVEILIDNEIDEIIEELFESFWKEISKSFRINERK